MSMKRRSKLALAMLLALLAGALILIRQPAFGDWLWSATGEEDIWEGIKGVGALALLELTGPELDLAPDAVEDHVDGNPYGVNTFLQLEPDPENVRRSLATMRDAGIGWARQQFPWEDIEIHARGDFEDRRNGPGISAWDKYDRIVQMAGDHGVDLLARLDDPPDWAYTDPEAQGPQKGPPDDLEDYGNYVAAVVGRYCGHVRYYQIWNEPNIYPEWGERDVDPAGYAALLKLAAARAREACEDVVIVSAALAPTTEPGGRNMHDLRYLEALYAAGWQADFDVLAAQAFGLWTGPTDHRVSEDRTNFVRPLLLRDIMVRAGDAHKAVWITEFGWDSPPEELEAVYGRVDEPTRARYTRLAYERIAAEWPWIGVSNLWYLRRPDWEWHQRPEGYFRMIEPDWTPTETYTETAGLAMQVPAMGRGRHGPAHVALGYSGPWRDHPREGRLEQRVGTESAELQFGFVGSGYEISLLPPPVEAEGVDAEGSDGAGSSAETSSPDADASGDAAADDSSSDAAATTTDDADAEVELVAADENLAPELFVVLDGEFESLHPQQRGDRLVFGEEGLEPGEHVVILRIDAGEAWLDEVRITGPDPASPLAPLWRVLAGAGLGIGFALVLIWRMGRGRAGRGRDETSKVDGSADGPGPAEGAVPTDGDGAANRVDPAHADSPSDEADQAPG